MNDTLRPMTVDCGLAFSLLTAGCAMQEQQTMQSLKQPINCATAEPLDHATAEGDIRVLQNEKTTVASKMAQGLTAVAPAGIVVGVLTGTEGTKLRVAAGDYNTQIDQRIAAIKSTCRVT